MYKEEEKILVFLHNLALMFKHWGIDSSDWVIENKFFFRDFLHDHPDNAYFRDLHIVVNCEKLPWQPKVKNAARIIPPADSQYFKDFFSFIDSFNSFDLYVSQKEFFDSFRKSCDKIIINDFEILQLPVLLQYRNIFSNKKVFDDMVLDEDLAFYLYLGYLYALKAKDLRLFNFLKTIDRRQDNKIKANIISRKKVKGKIKFLFKYPAYPAPEINKDDIIVVKDLTNEIVPLILKAGGVISEKGGINCHASIICRELNLPGAVGVADVFARFRAGDLVEIDPSGNMINIIKPFNFSLSR